MYNSEISAKLNEITLKNNIPVSATLELTYRCPLKCIHCYIPQEDRRQKSEVRGQKTDINKKELTTEEWKRVLKELSEAGCLYIVFTGGEPLLREDLPDLCKYATDLNFDIRIFTTGIIERLKINEFKKTNVSRFEISFYGRKEIHNRITLNPDSFDITLDFAKRFKDAGFRVKLKTSLMKENFMEIDYIKKLAKENGFEYSFDPIIVPGNDGDKANLKHRLSPEKIEEIRKLLEKQEMNSFVEDGRYRPLLHVSHLTLYDFFCGAGKNLVGINPYGQVYPCIQIPVSCGDLRKNTFAEIWKNSRWLENWRKMTMADVKTCSTCNLSDKCNRCPGLALLEDGDILGPSSLACRLANIDPVELSASGGQPQSGIPQGGV